MAAILALFTGTSTPPLLTTNKLKASSSSPKAMKATTLSRPSYWATINADVDAHLETALPLRDPLVVHQPIHDLVFAAPKTMAPALCIAACELVGGHRADSVAAASALNLMLAASYTHQYLPNLLKRPKPSPFADNIELLSGDAIYPLGFEVLARSNGGEGDPERVLRVTVEIARAMGGQGLVEAQYTQVKRAKGEMDGADQSTLKLQLCEKREGRLYSCASACGAILGGAHEEDVEKLRRFGFCVGIIYGLLDGVGRGDDDVKDEVERFRSLALKELEGFDEGKIGAISSLVDDAIRPSLHVTHH